MLLSYHHMKPQIEKCLYKTDQTGVLQLENVHNFLNCVSRFLRKIDYY